MDILDLLTGKWVRIEPFSNVIWPARVEPPHKMHREYIVELTNIFSHVIIVIGSANAHGTPRHCIPAHVRCKMVIAMLDEVGLARDKYTIIPLDDFYQENGIDYDDEKWCQEMNTIAKMFHTSFIASGNEWIKTILEEHPQYGLRAIDPDCGITDTFRATDVRNSIIKGDMVALKRMVPFSVLQMLLQNDCYKSVILSNQNNAVTILPGRQTVDMVFLLKDTLTEKLYVLLGRRKKDKQDFPGVLALPGGAVEPFEWENEAVLRILREETGLDIRLQDTCFLEDPVKFSERIISLLTMKMVGIYSSKDPLKAGTQGGSSKCFTIFIEDQVEELRAMIRSKANGYLKDLEEVNFYEVDTLSKTFLAFQHDEMLEKAIYMAKAKIKIEKDRLEENFPSKCICLVGGSGTGKSTAAYGIMYQMKLCGISCEFTGEFAKDEVYENHLSEILDDQSYIIAMQNRRVKRLVNYGVRYIITDAPLVISAYHAAEDKAVEELAYHLFEQTNNVIIFMNKDDNMAFETKGRLEDEEKSNQISFDLKANLEARGYSYIEATGSTDTVIKALSFIAEDIEDEKVACKIERRIAILKKEKELENEKYEI